MAKKKRSRKGKISSSVKNDMVSSFDKYINIDIDAFKPRDGNNKIRILPGMGDDADHFGLKVFFHYQVGPDSGTYLCPLKMGTADHCPICEERARLQNTASDDYLNQLRPKPRVLSYVIDRKADDDEVKVWSMPVGSYSKPGFAVQVLEYATDEDTDEILPFDDYEEGYDVSFKVTNAGKYNAEYHTIKLANEPTPMVDDDDLYDEILEFLDENPLDSIIHVYDPEYLAKKFMAGDTGEEAETKDEEEEEETPRRPKKKRAKKKVAKKEVEEEEETDDPPFDTDEEEAEEKEEEEEQDAEDEKAQGRSRLAKFKKKRNKKKGDDE